MALVIGSPPPFLRFRPPSGTFPIEFTHLQKKLIYFGFGKFVRFRESSLRCFQIDFGKNCFVFFIG